MEKTPKSYLLILLLFILFIFSSFVFFKSDLRNHLRAYFAIPERKVLSVANGQIFPDQTSGRVVKLMTPEGLSLEVYGSPIDNKPNLVEKIPLPDKRDAFFQFRGRATNLALKDMDGDQVFEIIAPTYDSSLTPHLNIYRFNKVLKHFEKYTE